MTSTEIEILRTQVEELKTELLAESRLGDKFLDLRALGWMQVYGGDGNNEGPTLDELHSIVPRLQDMAATNPLHIRGAQLRHGYVFGEGIQFTDTKAAAEKVMEDPDNRDSMFSVGAWESLNLALFTDGNAVVVKNTATNSFTQVPFTQITGVRVDIDDASKIQYIQRSWSRNGKQLAEWIPLARHKRRIGKVPTTLPEDSAQVPVSQINVAYVRRGRKLPGWTWGLPDSLGALIWSEAYTGYLSDNSKLVHTLMKFAWTVTQGDPSAKGTAGAAAQVANNRVGGTAFGAEISSVGVPSAQVNMNNGQPLAALVAASFGVPVIALLSSPGATGGSYGAATTLDAPTIQGFLAIQHAWKEFFEEIIRDLGSKSATVTFPSIENDAPYRQITSLSLAFEGGAIWPDEYRDAVLELLNVRKLHDEVPPKPAVANVTPRQGNTGAVPGGTEQNVTNHDADNE